jgi:hypothetical protein
LDKDSNSNYGAGTIGVGVGIDKTKGISTPIPIPTPTPKTQSFQNENRWDKGSKHAQSRSAVSRRCLPRRLTSAVDLATGETFPVGPADREGWQRLDLELRTREGRYLALRPETAGAQSRTLGARRPIGYPRRP